MSYFVTKYLAMSQTSLRCLGDDDSTKIIMSEHKHSTSFLKRSLLDPATKPRYPRINRKNRSLIEPDQTLNLSTPEALPLASLCMAKNYQQMPDQGVRRENKLLKAALIALNRKLTQRVERKKLRMDTVGSTQVSIRGMMEYVPKDLQEEIRKNEEVIEMLKEELEKDLRRKSVVEDINYRVKVDGEVGKVNDSIKQIEGQIKALRRGLIFREKEIVSQEKSNQGDELFKLRKELIRANRDSKAVEGRLVEVQVQGNALEQKVLILSEKESLLRGYFQVQVRQREEDIQQNNVTEEFNRVYLQDLHKLKASKRRFVTADDLCKVKYYNALKKLDIEVYRHHKLDALILEMEGKIRAKKDLAQIIASKIESVQEEILQFQEQQFQGAFMTELYKRPRLKQNSVKEMCRSVMVQLDPKSSLKGDRKEDQSEEVGDSDFVYRQESDDDQEDRRAQRRIR